MLALLFKIIPLEIGVLIGSPMILVLTLFLLGSTHKIRSVVFFLGNLLIAITVSVLGLSLGNNFQENLQPTTLRSALDLVFGIFFLIFSIKVLFSKDKPILNEGESPKLFRWFLVGFLISLTNFDSVLLSLAAGKLIGEAPASYITKIILIIINILFFTLPIGLPIILYICMPKIARPFLEKINQLVLKYNRYILSIMFLAFGIYFIYKGFKFFF